jgi:uncharacterized protein YbjT (DUF2867 family)
MTKSLSVVMLGASGATGGAVVAKLCSMPSITKLSLLGRRPVAHARSSIVVQHIVDPLSASTYKHLLAGHDCAVCTFGVSQPSTMTREEFIRIDKDAVLSFGAECKAAGIRHFELLGSASADPQSRFPYLKTKGELREGLAALDFGRLSIFQPSMILTPTNRFGLSQALTLTFWPMLTPLLLGPWRKYRGIRVETLGAAMAANLVTPGQGLEILHWDQFLALAAKS